MKKKIMITSILCAITALSLVGYFVGCSQSGGDAVFSPPADKLSEEADVVYADVAEAHDSEVQMPTKPQDALSQLQKDAKDKSPFDIKYGKLKIQNLIL